MLNEATLDRVMDRISFCDGGCWEWTGEVSPKGYGKLKFKGGTFYAHRFIYALVCEPIPDGMQIDHLCRNRCCVNPDHLDVVTNQVNATRGTGWAGQNARKTHCPQGHPYEGDNLRLTSKGRECWICVRKQKSAQKKRAALRRKESLGTPVLDGILG